MNAFHLLSPKMSDLPHFGHNNNFHQKSQTAILSYFLNALHLVQFRKNLIKSPEKNRQTMDRAEYIGQSNITRGPIKDLLHCVSRWLNLHASFILLQFKKGMHYVKGANVIMILTIMKGNQKHFTSSGI